MQSLFVLLLPFMGLTAGNDRSVVVTTLDTAGTATSHGRYCQEDPSNPAVPCIKDTGKFSESEIATLDLTITDPDLNGFNFGFADGTYGYAVPWYGKDRYHGKVARFLLSDFTTVQMLDLAVFDPDLKGFFGGFSDGTYGYVVPQSNGNDGAAGINGKVARFLLSDFSTIQVLDLTAIDPNLKGFCGGFTDGIYGYVVPYGTDIGVVSGKAARFLLSDFSTSTVEVLDLTTTDPELKGFRYGFTAGAYGYFMPHHHTYVGSYSWQNSGKVARFLLSDYSTVQVLDLAATDPDLKGFQGGFTDGTYGYAVPNVEGGKAARFLLSDFSTVQVLDLTATDPDLNGLAGGFSDGTYGYMMPYYGGKWGSKVARFLLSDFSTVEVMDMAATDPDRIGFCGTFTDGAYAYVVPYSSTPEGFHGKIRRFSVTPHTLP